MLLLILDGWGYRQSHESNAIACAHTPIWDYLCARYPLTLLKASGEDVGLPAHQMGNSEVGHLTIGSGRIIPQSLERVNQSIAQGHFSRHPVLMQCFEEVKKKNSTLHVVILLSSGGVHSHEAHCHALLSCAAQHQIKTLYLHLACDGRDTAPQSVLAFIQKLESHCQQTTGMIATMIGRAYAMDRDKNWDRTEKAYQLICHAQAAFKTHSPTLAIQQAYSRGETDEFISAIAMDHYQGVQEHDVMFCMNFRADRMKQLSARFLAQPSLSQLLFMTPYFDKITREKILFSKEKPQHVLSEVLSSYGLKQLKIAETEKYAHVSYFFNGGRETPYPQEEWFMIPSHSLQHHDQKPAMRCMEITKHILQYGHQYDFIVCNFANPDMIGHTGNFKATKEAIEVVDSCIGQLYRYLRSQQRILCITADHGNAECMYNHETQQRHTSHTNSAVPFLSTHSLQKTRLKHPVYNLSAVTSTLLDLWGIPKPIEMTAPSLK